MLFFKWNLQKNSLHTEWLPFFWSIKIPRMCSYGRLYNTCSEWQDQTIWTILCMCFEYRWMIFRSEWFQLRAATERKQQWKIRIYTSRCDSMFGAYTPTHNVLKWKAAGQSAYENSSSSSKYNCVCTIGILFNHHRLYIHAHIRTLTASRPLKNSHQNKSRLCMTFSIRSHNPFVVVEIHRGFTFNYILWFNRRTNNN